MMNHVDAINFLKQHQPMPCDEELTQQLIDTYDEVRVFFMDYLDPECVPLFLNSFGEGSGCGVYQLVDFVLAQYPDETVVPSLVAALRSPYRGVVYWSAQISAYFPSEDLLPPLTELLNNADAGIRSAAITAIDLIPSKQRAGILFRALEHEQDPSLVRFLKQAIES